MSAKTIILSLILLLTACGEDPCAEIVRRTCGDEDQCADRKACSAAKGLLENGVTAACSEALDNPLAYPACKKN